MNIYLAYKALHLIAVISWMAGLLYLPELFITLKIKVTKIFLGFSKQCKKTLFLYHDNLMQFLDIWIVFNCSIGFEHYLHTGLRQSLSFLTIYHFICYFKKSRLMNTNLLSFSGFSMRYQQYCLFDYIHCNI